MGLKNVIKKGISLGFNVKDWMGVEHIKQNTSFIGRLFKKIFEKKSEKEQIRGTFEECMQRLNMTEEDLQQRMKSSVQIVTYCLIGSVGTFAYMLYLFICGQALSAFTVMMLTFLLWAYSFREHFNLYQMKQRRLGCTFREWFIDTFKGSK